MSVPVRGPVVLAGAGNMGCALLAGWLARGLDPASVIIQEPALSGAAADLVAKLNLHAVAEIDELVEAPSVIVAAVKPQAMDAVLPGLARIAGPHTVLLSIAAGRSLASIEGHFAPATAVVRAMPNTPAAIGRGITAAIANNYLDDARRDVCEALLRAVGDVVWLDTQDQIDAVTAVSGSGPAYVFLLAESMAAAGVAAGLSTDLAMQLARATVSGAAELLHLAKLEPAELRRNVTSPGGTTAAALDVLMREGNGMGDLLRDAVLAGQRRSRELGA